MESYEPDLRDLVALQDEVSRSIATQIQKGNGALPDVGSVAETYVTLGGIDRAFKVMEAEYQRHDGGLLLRNSDPRLDCLKSDPRYQQLLQCIGLPQ